MSKKIAIKINGVSPFLMHSPDGVNPLHPLVIAIKKITSKPAKQKTEDDLIRLMDLEFELNGYWDADGKPYIPAHMLEATIRNGNRKARKGKSVEAGIIVEPDRILLVYGGPQTMEQLRADQSFRDVREVAIKGSKTLRCRPRFNNWQAEFTINYIPSIIDRQIVIDALIMAGQVCAIGDNRPRYGRFGVEVTK